MNSQVLMVPVTPAPFWKTSPDARSLLEEPHHLILSFEGVQARITDCMCSSCREHAKSALDLAFAQPEKVVDLLHKHGVWEIGLVPHQILTLPGPDGSPTDSMIRLQEFVDQIRSHGCLAHIVKPINPTPGTWVRVKETIWISSEHILVPGMLGEIKLDAQALSSPGISVWAQMVGRDDPYLYFCQHLEVAPRPDSNALAEARKIADKGLSHYEEVHGYSGYIQIGREKPRTEFEAKAVLVNALDDAVSASNSSRIKAAQKRVETVLRAFTHHAQCHEASTLLANIQHGVDWAELVPSILHFAKS